MKNYSLFVISVLIPCLCFAESSRAEEPPNIIIFLADDMGLGDTSAYQDWTKNPDSLQLSTPAMERLAKQGVRFTDAHSPSSRCSPTRYALLTGRYCWRTRLKHWVLFGVHCPPLIERERITFPEFLQASGYRTAMFGKWHLGLTYRNREGNVAIGWDDADLTKPLADGPLDHGFDTFLVFPEVMEPLVQMDRRKTPRRNGLARAGSKGDRFLVRRVTGKNSMVHTSFMRLEERLTKKPSTF